METSVSFFYVLSVMNLLYVPLSGAHRGAPAARAAPPRESEENPCVATKFCTSVWNLHPPSCTTCTVKKRGCDVKPNYVIASACFLYLQ